MCHIPHGHALKDAHHKQDGSIGKPGAKRNAGPTYWHVSPGPVWGLRWHNLRRVCRGVSLGQTGRVKALPMGTATDGGEGFKERTRASGGRPMGAASLAQRSIQAACQSPPPPPAPRPPRGLCALAGLCAAVMDVWLRRSVLGPPPNASPRGATPIVLLWSLQSGSAAMVKLLFEHSPPGVRSAKNTNSGATPLHLSIYVCAYRGVLEG